MQVLTFTYNHPQKPKQNKNYRAGFTLVELMVTIAIFSMLVGVGAFSLIGAQHQSELASDLNTFLSDVKDQQVKAMTGDTDGESSSQKYGIYFSTNGYTLFTGSSYNPAATSNYVVTFPTGIELQTINLPGSTLIFNGDGTIDGYSSTQNSVTLVNTNSSDQKTVNFNKLGVITQVN